MTIPKLTPYTGQVANPDGSQTQTEFTANMFNQLGYEAQLAMQVNNTVDGINSAVDEVEVNAVSAQNSSDAAQAAANFEGEFVAGATSAEKGKSYLYDGDIWLCLQNTTTTPSQGSSEWKLSVGEQYVTTAQGDVLGGKLFKGSNGKAVQDGDTILAGTTHLRVLVSGKPTIVAMSPAASGVVSLLTESGATVGTESVSFTQANNLDFFNSKDKSAVYNMIDYFARNPLSHAIGTQVAAGSTIFEYADSTGPINQDNFRAFNAVSVRDLKAKGDGVTDDTNSIKAAIAYLGNSGGTIFFPRGVYFVTSTIDIPTITGSDTATQYILCGEGYPASVVKFDFDGICIEGNGGTIINNIGIDGTNNRGAGKPNSVGIKLAPTWGGMNYVRIVNCATGLLMNNPTGATLHRLNISRCGIGIDGESGATGGYGGNLIRMRNCYIHFNGLGLASLDWWQSVIENNAFEYNDQSFRIRNFRGGSVAHNWLEADTNNSVIINSQSSIHSNREVGTKIDIEYTSDFNPLQKTITEELSGVFRSNGFIVSNYNATNKDFDNVAIKEGTSDGYKYTAGVGTRTLRFNINNDAEPLYYWEGQSGAGMTVFKVFNDDYFPSTPIRLFEGTTFDSGGNRKNTSIEQSSGGAINFGFSVSTSPTVNKLSINSEAAYPTVNNELSCGKPGNAWSEIFATNGAINPSDERKKQFMDITESERLAAIAIKSDIRKFKWNDAIDVKGENARLHFGVGAQSVVKIMQNHGLNPFDYSFICYDEWDGDEKGMTESLYGIRYSELCMFILAAI